MAALNGLQDQASGFGEGVYLSTPGTLSLAEWESAFGAGFRPE